MIMFIKGIIILLVNSYSTTIYNWDNTFPLFTAFYSDFIPGWFNNVGAVIIFTMIMNIFVPHISALLTMFLQNIKRGCDCGFEN